MSVIDLCDTGSTLCCSELIAFVCNTRFYFSKLDQCPGGKRFYRAN